MDLHGIVSSAIGTVNPFVTVSLQRSTGYTTAASGRRTPTYAAAVDLSAQVQPITYKDIQQMDALNLQGTRKAFYFKGQAAGIVRQNEKGGDLITMADETVWLVAIVLEDWPDWCKIGATLQNTQPS